MMKANYNSRFLYPVAFIFDYSHSYYHTNSCWIGVERGAIWGFVAPMLAVIVVSRLSGTCL